jgi:hypothetical protein
VIGVDALYVAARRILLDVLEALGPHRPKFVLVGAQAVYLQAGDADMEVVAPYTKDADLGIDARDLDRDPSILGLMTAAGFSLKITRAGGVEPGTWVAETDVDGKQTLVPVDLLVPEALGTAMVVGTPGCRATGRTPRGGSRDWKQRCGTTSR